MSENQMLAVIRDELGRLAPEIDFDAVDRDQPIQREFDIDSMDFLNFITALHQRLGVNVPETDYAKIATLSGALSYLAKRLETGTAAPRPDGQRQ
jgi:acyl carrier protein